MPAVSRQPPIASHPFKNLKSSDYAPASLSRILTMLPIRYPIRVPYTPIVYQCDVIGQVPDVHPTNFQYSKPPIAPAIENMIIKRCLVRKFFIQ